MPGFAGDVKALVGEISDAWSEAEALTEKIETVSPAGRLVFHVFAALAEFERNLIRERSILRRCRCGAELPTLFLFGRNRLHAVCPHPHCGHTLNTTILTVGDLFVPIVGGVSSGKGSVMTASLIAFEKQESGLSISFPKPADQKESLDQQRYHRARSEYMAGHPPEKIPESKVEALQVTLGDTRGHKRLLYAYDAAGETHRGEHALGSLPYYSHIHGLLFLIDPFSLRGEGRLSSAPVAAHTAWIRAAFPERRCPDRHVGAHTEAHEVDPSSLAAVPLSHLPLTALDFDLSRDGATLSFLGENPAHPAEVSVWRKDTVDVLTDTNPQIAQWSLGTEREVQWRNPKDGHTVYGVLSLPPGYLPGHPYKTAIHMHGGPEEAFTVGFNANWYNYAALLASQGYVVLQPNYRGSAGQEIAFTEADYKDLGGGDFDDVMAGVDWAVAQGYSDPTRLVIAGWSYGGFLTAWAVTHTDRFKAAMAGAPITDQLGMASTTDIMTYMTDYLGPLAGHLPEYDRHSPVRFTSACQTPVLVLQGQADVRVPTSQGEEFYHALILENRETEMVTYPREPHIFSERAHQIDSLTRELQWFDQHLPASPNRPAP